MKNQIKYVLAVGSAVFALSTSSFAIVFSNVTIGGSLSSGASYFTGTNDIDFFFPEAIVGDPVDPIRQGNIIITYEAKTDTNLDFVDINIVSLLGALDGSGRIYFNEVVEDMVTPGIIASYDALILPGELPFFDTIHFDRPSSHIKVKKTFSLFAEDTDAFDVAQISLVEQNFVPEPATLLAIGAGLAALAARRRK